MKISDLENIDPSRITNILFDWGGVITEIDFDIAIEKFKELGYHGFTKQKGNYPHSDIMLKFEVGEIPPQAILDYMLPKMNNGATPEKIWEAWNSLLLDTPKEHIDLLQSLGERYNLMLLSNTNIIHTDYYRGFLEKKYGQAFFDIFSHIFLSHELGLRKPEETIFNKVIEVSRIEPAKTLFIDDLESNIDAADKLGFISLHHLKNAPLKPVFEKWLV